MKLLVKPQEITLRRPRFNMRARNGRDGIDGLTGLAGTHGNDGLNGSDGLPGINGATGINGAPGINGQQGPVGLPGASGKNAPTIVKIKKFSMNWIFVLSDGTEITVPIEKPHGTKDNPQDFGGGQRPPIMALLEGAGIDIVETPPGSGRYQISSFVGLDTGLPYFFIPADQIVTIPENRQHLTLGDVTISGEIINNGEMVII